MRFGIFGAAALAVSVFLGTAGAASVANAKVNVTVDLSTQRMHVTSSSGSYTWKVSTGRGRYNTPRGSYRPTVLRRMHYSRKYNNSPMPYSVFFRGGYAIHGTSYVSRLGTPASHGCVRLATPNAAKLYAMIKREGARITITGSRAQFYANYKPARSKVAAVRKDTSRYASASRSSGKTVYVKRYKKVAYYVKRYKNGKKYYVKRYKSKTYYVKRVQGSKYAASKRTGKRTIAVNGNVRNTPLGYAPVPRSRSTFDFFQTPFDR